MEPETLKQYSLIDEYHGAKIAKGMLRITIRTKSQRKNTGPEIKKETSEVRKQKTILREIMRYNSYIDK